MYRRAFAFLLLVLSAAAAFAQSPADRHFEATRIKNERAGDAVVLGSAACTPKPLVPPATVTGNLTSASCLDTVINSYEDIYNLQGTAGQTVTIELSSTQFEVFLYMEGVDVEFVSFLSSGVSRQRIVFTFSQTRTYKLEAETLYGPGDAQPHTGTYTLSVTVAGGGGSTCTANATTMCLNDRFAVSATYNTGTTSGNASPVRLTTDSGYMTFFSASNIEVVIKVLNACSFNQRFWVFAGGLTDQNAVITVRDTKTGTVKTYTNPQGTPFQPIQDTSAFATCP